MSTEKRQKILETAMKLFVKKGIQGTSTSLIAKEAGVATGTLFHHFPTKEDLLHELYNSIFDKILAYQSEYFNPDTDVKDRLHQIWKLDIEWGTSHPEYTHFLERYSFFYYASEQAIIEAYERFEHCMETFRKAIEQNLMKMDDINYVSDHYIANIRMNILYFIKNPEICNADYIDKTFEIYWKGITNES
jgi:AcrR family transcriptional regulator